MDQRKAILPTLCKDCGCLPPVSNRVRCAYCLSAYNEYQSGKRQDVRAAELVEFPRSKVTPKRLDYRIRLKRFNSKGLPIC